jgi:hypothetical protein
MNWKTWTQLLAALVVVGLCVYIGKLILPVVQTMTPVIAWTLGVVIVVVLISLGLGCLPRSSWGCARCIPITQSRRLRRASLR